MVYIKRLCSVFRYSIYQMESRTMKEVLPESSEAVLNLPKDGHYKITKSGKVKLPRRLLHCSDGIYEEYSTDEEEEEEEEDVTPVVDPKTLTWGPYVWYYTAQTASKGLAVCDYLGEKLAWFFGITTPRFQYALDEIERRKLEQEEDEQQEREEREAELQYVKSLKESTLRNSGYENTGLQADEDIATQSV